MRRTTETTETSSQRSRAFTILIGLAALAVLLQGLWAGVFLEHDGRRDAAGTWINVHARGADISIALALVATVVAFVRIRDRVDLWIGGAIFFGLLVLESYLGGLIRDQSKDALTVIHIPLAMGLMGLAVWLPFRSTRQ